MSVNVYDKSKVGTADELTPVATMGRNRVWTGTKAAAEAAMRNGDIGNGTVVYITDDYDDKTVIDTANYAVTAGVANEAKEAKAFISEQIPNDGDINLYYGSKYWDKVYWAAGGNSIKGKPEYVGAFSLRVLRDATGATEQICISQNSIHQKRIEADGSSPTGWIRLASMEDVPKKLVNGGWTSLGLEVQTTVTLKDFALALYNNGYSTGSHLGFVYYYANSGQLTDGSTTTEYLAGGSVTVEYLLYTSGVLICNLLIVCVNGSSYIGKYIETPNSGVVTNTVKRITS